MYYYIDESGQTGLNLFDDSQPFLYYGVLSSKYDLDLVASSTIRYLRNQLGVERLHASELGNARLVDIVDEIDELQIRYDFNFDFYRLVKKDHAAICFFDQVFDQGLNPAVPWSAYWTPLRYVLLIKVAYLFDDETLKKAWDARVTVNDEEAQTKLVNVCRIIKSRVGNLPDQRSIQIITDALTWAINNPSKIDYNVDTKKDALQISPNLIGFQSVMHGIANRTKISGLQAKRIIVDRQTQFNKAQEYIADFYQKGRDVPWMSGPGLPVMDLKNMPHIPITCTAGTESIGLELVDTFLWIFKRKFENKELASPLNKIIHFQLQQGMCDEVSIEALQNRWGQWFDELPEPSEDDLRAAKEYIKQEESRRSAHI